MAALNCVNTDNDEDFARKLQQEEARLYQQHLRLTALAKLDLDFAKQLQQQEEEGRTGIVKKEEKPITSQNQSATDLVIPSIDTNGISSDKDNRRHMIDLTIDHFYVDEHHDTDSALAKQLQQEEDDKRRKGKEKEKVVNSVGIKEICTVGDEYDPNPDLHGLFLAFNELYFNNKLSSVEVKWSKRMTLCAGTCRYMAGGLCTVTLSEPLLKFRPRSDMIDTLLHEMIHALLFITRRFDDHDGHGPEFLSEAARINKLAGTNITVYHNFHDEVKHYKTHIWQCNGPCQQRPPYFGKISRSMNRPPQKADSWFAEHQLMCGGTFIKISSPPAKQKGKGSKKRKTGDDHVGKTMTDYMLKDYSDNKDGPQLSLTAQDASKRNMTSLTSSSAPCQSFASASSSVTR